MQILLNNWYKIFFVDTFVWLCWDFEIRVQTVIELFNSELNIKSIILWFLDICCYNTMAIGEIWPMEMWRCQAWTEKKNSNQ